VSILAHLTIDTIRVIPALHTHAATLVLAHWRDTRTFRLYFGIVLTSIGVTKTLTLFTIVGRVVRARRPWFLIEQWTTLVAHVTACVVLAMTPHLSGHRIGRTRVRMTIAYTLATNRYVLNRVEVATCHRFVYEVVILVMCNDHQVGVECA
jgi:hypothetical protein